MFCFKILDNIIWQKISNELIIHTAQQHEGATLCISSSVNSRPSSHSIS